MKLAVICLLLLIVTPIDLAMAEDQSMPEGTIYGHVYDAQTKQPISGAWVYCQENKCTKQLTDSDGYYAIENCFSPSSTYHIQCTKNGYPTAKNTAQTDSSGKAKVDFNLGTPNPPPKPNPTQVTSWEQTFGGSGKDYGNEVHQTNDGGYIIIGKTDVSTKISEQYLNNIWLIKIDPQGNMQWDRKFSGHSIFGNDYSVLQANDGNYIIAGCTSSTPISDQIYIWLTKIDSNGNKLWEKTFGESEKGISMEVRQTSDGGYVIVGIALPFMHLRLIKTDSNGNKIWDRIIGGADFIIISSIRETSDGGYILTGNKRQKDEWIYYIWLIKTDLDGNMQWDRTFGGLGADIGYSVMQTRDGGYTIAGLKDSSSKKINGCLVKTDANGNELWEKTFSASENMSWFVAYQTLEGGYILAGTKHLTDVKKDETLLIKTDANGNEIWERTFEDASCKSVEQTSDGGYIIIGAKMGDIWLKKTDAEGN